MQENSRIEKDLLGEIEVPESAYFGAHTVRAIENFPISGRSIHPELIKAFGAVKLAAARANRGHAGWSEDKFLAIERAASEMMAGSLSQHIVVDSFQGGAGTSTNMNVNEVLANRAIMILGGDQGEYEIVHPLEDINLHQSTNDTYPTALKVAAIVCFRNLEREVVQLAEAFQKKEKEFAHVVKVGRTQTQDAVLTTLGREMCAYAECISRDRWRIYKCEERLRVVNLGGTAIGTGLGAPRAYIFSAVEELRSITGIGLARAENLVEATQNADVFVEVSGILKALAVNLIKISTDLRLLSSGPDSGIAEINLPARQAGSSIMPGKVNPVIPETVTQASIAACAHDQAVAHACSLGNLELNPFLPLIAEYLLGSITLLHNACSVFRKYCIMGITANEKRCRDSVENSTAAVTALLPVLGYEKCQELARRMKEEHRSLRELVLGDSILSSEEFEQLISPESVTRLGNP